MISFIHLKYAAQSSAPLAWDVRLWSPATSLPDSSTSWSWESKTIYQYELISSIAISILNMAHLLQHSQQPFDGGHECVCRLAQELVVDVILLLHGPQRLLGLAQSAFHLLQLPGQRFVGLLQLTFNLCVFICDEKQHRVRWCVKVKGSEGIKNNISYWTLYITPLC